MMLITVAVAKIHVATMIADVEIEATSYFGGKICLKAVFLR